MMKNPIKIDPSIMLSPSDLAQRPSSQVLTEVCSGKQMVCLGHVGIIGLSGRMGQRIVSVLEKQGGFRSILGYDSRSDEVGKTSALCSNLDELFEKSSVVIDFSSANLFPNILDAALNNPKPMLIGTTGIDRNILGGIEAIGRSVPILVAPNTSLGAVIQRWMVKRLASILPQSYDIDIIEHHHRHKQDIPSGTALALADAMIHGKKDQGQDFSAGKTTSPRQDGRIEMHGLRCGHVFGMHEVICTGKDDRLVLGHTVFSPHIFADGAITLARWMMNGQNAGMYLAEDALGLSTL
jgi:4-hydroxy-tetrahydrodipicolinate reductase